MICVRCFISMSQDVTLNFANSSNVHDENSSSDEFFELINSNIAHPLSDVIQKICKCKCKHKTWFKIFNRSTMCMLYIMIPFTINFLNGGILLHEVRTPPQKKNVTVIQRGVTKFETRERNFDPIIAN